MASKTPETTAPQYAFTAAGGHKAYTALTPEQQLEVQRRYLRGESPYSIAQSLSTHRHAIQRFIRALGLEGQQGAYTDEVLREQFLQFRNQQFSIAGDRLKRWRELGEQLLDLAQTIDGWQAKQPDSMTVPALAKLLEQFRKTEHDWLRLAGINLDTTEHQMRVIKEEAAPQITVQQLFDGGMSQKSIEELIEAIEHQQQAAPPPHLLSDNAAV